LQPPYSRLPIDELRTDWLTALNDAVVAVLVPAVPFDRRHLAVVFTDGVDTISISGTDILLDLARRSETVVHVVHTEGHSAPGLLGQPVGLRPDPQGPAKLLQVAEITGGRRDWPGVFTGSIVGAFQNALDDFRSSYVLRYRPKGVATSGWHDIAVKVTRSGQFTVRSRKGYAS